MSKRREEREKEVEELARIASPKGTLIRVFWGWLRFVLGNIRKWK